MKKLREESSSNLASIASSLRLLSVSLRFFAFGFTNNNKISDCRLRAFWYALILELITFEILAAERLRLMGFDNHFVTWKDESSRYSDKS